VSTLTLIVGTDGGSVDVTVGVRIGVEVSSITAVGDDVCPSPWVRAKDVSVASTSRVGVGVTVGKLHASAAAIKLLSMKTMPLFFFIQASFTSQATSNMSIQYSIGILITKV
jgi:hypothetical protein